MRRSSTNVLAASRAALRNGFLGSAPGITLDDRGHVAEAIQNLIDGVRCADFEADLRQGDGNELAGKFRAAHSSSALAVNTFAPFRSRLAELTLAGGSGFTNLCFERKCPHGLLGRKPPNLDVVAECPRRILAIESKCLEHLGSHVAKFAPAYQAEITDHRCTTPWFREMLRLIGEPRSYSCSGSHPIPKRTRRLTNIARRWPDSRHRSTAANRISLRCPTRSSGGHGAWSARRRGCGRISIALSGVMAWRPDRRRATPKPTTPMRKNG